MVLPFRFTCSGLQPVSSKVAPSATIVNQLFIIIINVLIIIND